PPILGGANPVARAALRARREIPDLLRADPAEEVTMSGNNPPKHDLLSLGLAVTLLAILSQARAAEKTSPPPVEPGPRGGVPRYPPDRDWVSGPPGLHAA